MHIQELATRAESYFERRERPPARQGDEPGHFYTLKDRHPVWVQELAHKAHGDMMPDNFRYETIVDVLQALSEGQDPEEPSLEADVYNHDLLAWLASNLERAGYVDEAVEQFGHAGEGGSRGGGITGDIAQGQWYEKDEIWRLVVEALNERLEGIEAGESEEFEQRGKKSGPKDWNPNDRK